MLASIAKSVSITIVASSLNKATATLSVNDMSFPMLKWSIIFLIVAVIAAIFGFGGIAGVAAGIAKVLFFIFLILFIISLVAGGMFVKKVKDTVNNAFK